MPKPIRPTMFEERPVLKIESIKPARCFHHESDTIEETRHCLLSLLDEYRSLEFVVNIVDTLTILATRSSLHARSQIDVLLHQKTLPGVSRSRQTTKMTLITEDSSEFDCLTIDEDDGDK